MPVCLHRDPLGGELSKCTRGLRGKHTARFQDSAAGCLDIGLLNIMPDAALQSTERQFLTLIDSAAGDIVVHLSFYSLPDVPRSDSGRRHVESFYSGIRDLWHSHLDGLIVTGTEPRSSNLMDESYWGSLIEVLDWAGESTYSTICSCLSAHAAVLYLDGINRRRLRDKRLGLFECAPVSNHPLIADTPSHFRMPHSRWNEIPEDELASCGYVAMTRARDGSVDMFVKRKKSLFVFFQGHPEYETNTLLLEYRRDVGRYLRQERDIYPSMPLSYFNEDAANILTALQERASADRHEKLLEDFPTARVETTLENNWRPVAERIWRNWLIYLCTQKQREPSRFFLTATL
jgi:homoserine O-succinyltransferase